DGLFERLGPGAEEADPGLGANKTEPHDLRLLRSLVRSEQKEPVLGMRCRLAMPEFEIGLLEMQNAQQWLVKQHQPNSSSGSGRPSVETSASSSSSASRSGSSVLTGDVKSSGVASRTNASLSERGRRMKDESPERTSRK